MINCNNIIETTNHLSGDTTSSSEVNANGTLFQALWRGRIIIVLFVVFGIITGVLYLRRITPLYSSTSKIIVEQDGIKAISEIEDFMTQSKNYLYTQSSLITSMPIFSTVASNSKMQKLKTFQGDSNLLGYLKKHVSVSVGRKDDIISVSCTSPYCKDTAAIVDAIVESYIGYHSSQKKNTSSEVLKILQYQKSKSDQKLHSKYAEILKFKQDNDQLALQDGRNNVLINNLERVMSVLTDARITAVNAKADYEAIKSIKNDPEKIQKYIMMQDRGMSVNYNKTESLLKTDLNRLKQDRLSHLKKMTEEHPAIIAIDNKIVDIKKELDEISNKSASSNIEVSRQRMVASKQRAQEFQLEVDQLQASVRELNMKAAELAMLEAEKERFENECDTLDANINKWDMTEDAGAMNITVLEKGQVSNAPVSPNRFRVMVFAMVCSIMLGLSVALCCDWIDQRMHDIEEISTVIGAPVLGTIPSIKEYKTIPQRGQVVLNNPTSIIAEAFKAIRTAVYFGISKEYVRTILITSPSSGEGKSTVVSNLASAMAQSGQRTLVLDCDFRRPMQHEIFEIDAKSGLSSVLAGQEWIDDIINDTNDDNLKVITTGKIPQNPSELLNSKMFGSRCVCSHYFLLFTLQY